MWIEYLRIALGVLRAHKFRSLLTVASITIGAFSIVLMTSLADSGLSTLAAGIEEIGGARLISVWRKPPEAMEARQLSRTEIVISGMIVIGAFGFLSDQLVMLIGRRLLAWSPSHG